MGIKSKNGGAYLPAERWLVTSSNEPSNDKKHIVVPPSSLSRPPSSDRHSPVVAGEKKEYTCWPEIEIASSEIWVKSLKRSSWTFPSEISPEDIVVDMASLVPTESGRVAEETKEEENEKPYAPYAKGKGLPL